MSIATENFIKAIYKNQHQDGLDTKPGNIARKLGISNAAATDMAKKLATRDLVHYEKYQQLKLTEKGKELALNILRKHRLWESFLFKLFDLNLHDIHREAELLEHQTSDFLAEKISAYLGHPKFDPHGDPIPNADGIITTEDTSIPLMNARENDRYVISRLMSDDKEFFEFCDTHGIKYGNQLTVIKQFPKNKMTEVEIDNRLILLNQEFTKIVYVDESI